MQKLAIWGYPFNETNAELKTAECNIDDDDDYDFRFDEEKKEMVYTLETKEGMSGGPIVGTYTYRDRESDFRESDFILKGLVGIHIRVSLHLYDFCFASSNDIEL